MLTNGDVTLFHREYDDDGNETWSKVILHDVAYKAAQRYNRETGNVRDEMNVRVPIQSPEYVTYGTGWTATEADYMIEGASDFDPADGLDLLKQSVTVYDVGSVHDNRDSRVTSVSKHIRIVCKLGGA